MTTHGETHGSVTTCGSDRHVLESGVASPPAPGTAPGRPDAHRFEDFAKLARQLANDLFSIPCSEQKHGGDCVTKEENRPLTRSEKNLGWSCRPFHGYSTDRMCLSCAAYFHAERAAQLLHEMDCWERRAEARKAVQS